MITKFLRMLFNSSNDVYRYSANPRHIFIPILLIAAGNSVAYYDGWVIAGITIFIIGVLLAVVIMLAINWEKCIEYWETINETVKLMQKITNPEVWEALGFKTVQQTVRVIENLNDDAKSIPETTSIHHIDFIPAIVFQSICDAVLTGAPLSEGEIVGRRIMKGPKFRKFQKLAAEKKWIKANNSRDNRQGFSLTKKGYAIFYEAASTSVKLKLKEKEYGT